MGNGQTGHNGGVEFFDVFFPSFFLSFFLSFYSTSIFVFIRIGTRVDCLSIGLKTTTASISVIEYEQFSTAQLVYTAGAKGTLIARLRKEVTIICIKWHKIDNQVLND